MELCMDFGLILFLILIFGIFWSISWIRESIKIREQSIIKIKKINDLINEKSKKDLHIKKLDNTISEMNKWVKDVEDIISKKGDESLLKNIASLASDFLTIHYSKSEKYLRSKKRPALKEAMRIADLKRETKLYIQENKELKYKYDYLFHLFPDLELYTDDLESINNMGKLVNTLDALEGVADRTKRYMSKEEYDKLPDNRKNPCATCRHRRGGSADRR